MIEVAGFSYSYPRQDLSLNNVNLRIPQGCFLVLTGPNGSGKTTLMRAMRGLVPFFYGGKVSGTVRIAGREITSSSLLGLGRKVGFVFQDPDLSVVGETVARDIAFSLENLGVHPSIIRKKIIGVSRALGCQHLLVRKSSELSGGELRLVTLASAFVLRPLALLLDEIFTFLDFEGRKRVLHVLRDLKQEGCTIIAAAHLTDDLMELADRVVVMNQGRIIADGPPREVFSSSELQTLIIAPQILEAFLKAGVCKSASELPVTLKQALSVLRARSNDVDLPT